MEIKNNRYDNETSAVYYLLKYLINKIFYKTYQQKCYKIVFDNLILTCKMEQ